MLKAIIPSKEDVINLSVGDYVLDTWGRNQAKVVDIYGYGLTPDGKEWVCFHQQFGPHSTISNDRVEDRLQRTVALTCRFTSHQLDDLEAEMLANGERERDVD